MESHNNVHLTPCLLPDGLAAMRTHGQPSDPSVGVLAPDFRYIECIQKTPSGPSVGVSPCTIKLYPEDARMTTYPLHRPGMFKFYTDAVAMFWSADEVDLSNDAMHYAELTSGERRFIDFILAFFSASDGFVTNNLDRFLTDVPIIEARYFFEFQKAMENTHAHMYSELIESLVPDAIRRRDLFQAVTGMPIITKITNYIAATTKSEAGFAERLLRMACIEGILFTGCFCAIYHFQQRGIMPGLAQSNEFIAKDEALHTLFAVYLYSLIESCHALRTTQVHEIVREFVVLAQEFIDEALPEPISGMNKKLLCDYIEAQADNLVDLMGVKKIYGTTHIFTFMFQQNLCNRTNFFERKLTDYMKISSGTTTAADDYYDNDADF